jgi:hypothetical protein
MARKPTDTVKLQLRFQESLRRRLERAAARNNRSMNTEIIHRLEESVQREATTAQELRTLRMLSDHMAQQGQTESFGTPLTEINAKLDKLIALAEEQEKEESSNEQAS